MLTSVTLALGPEWMNPETLLTNLGGVALWVGALIVFAECGLLLGFFLPGDSLLFTIGLFIGRGDIHYPLWMACVVLTIAAFLGNVVGYEIGRAAGPAIFNKDDSKLFRREYVDKTMAFFDHYGPVAIVLARFTPLVRTFITVTAGVGKMDRRKYLIYSAIGALLWATGITLLGRALGGIPLFRDHIEAGLLLLVVVSIIPMFFEAWRHRGKGGETTPEEVAEAAHEAGEEPVSARMPDLTAAPPVNRRYTESDYPASTFDSPFGGSQNRADQDGYQQSQYSQYQNPSYDQDRSEQSQDQRYDQGYTDPNQGYTGPIQSYTGSNQQYQDDQYRGDQYSQSGQYTQYTQSGQSSQYGQSSQGDQYGQSSQGDQYGQPYPGQSYGNSSQGQYDQYGQTEDPFRAQPAGDATVPGGLPMNGQDDYRRPRRSGYQGGHEEYEGPGRR